MCRTVLSLTSLFVVLALAGHAGAGQDPVAHYAFEDVTDFSNAGTSGGTPGEPKGDAQIIWDDDRSSYVLSLDGDGDYVYFGIGWQGIVTTSITVTAWIKTDSLGGSDGVAGLGYAWRLCGGSGGNIAFQVMNTQPVGAATGTNPVNTRVPGNPAQEPADVPPRGREQQYDFTNLRHIPNLYTPMRTRRQLRIASRRAYCVSRIA